MKADGFIDIPLTVENLDRYCVRKSILKAITEVLPRLRGNLLDAGCGKMPYRQYILGHSNVSAYTGLDIDSAFEYDTEIKPDVTWDGIHMPFNQKCFDCVIATEVLEHCYEPGLFLSEVFRVLKPGGFFFFTVPFLWPLHEVPHDAYRYTPFTLKRYLQEVGFVDIELKATGGWHASMAQMLGLWIKRAPLPSLFRKILSKTSVPLIKKLISYDKPDGFLEGEMITGISGTAIK